MKLLLFAMLYFGCGMLAGAVLVYQPKPDGLFVPYADPDMPVVMFTSDGPTPICSTIDPSELSGPIVKVQP